MRLRYGYLITCIDVVKDDRTGEITELHCVYDPETRGGHAPDGRKVRGTIHWVSAPHSIEAEIRLYDHLFTAERPEDPQDKTNYLEYLNSNSLETLTSCRIEPSLADAHPGSKYQFERQGYFCVDTVDSSPMHMVFNRTVPLRDSWARIQRRPD